MKKRIPPCMRVSLRLPLKLPQGKKTSRAAAAERRLQYPPHALEITWQQDQRVLVLSHRDELSVRFGLRCWTIRDLR
jgi:hypothetical protein